MGDMATSVNYHYSKGNIEALRRIANDSTIDDEDRDDARRFIDKIKERNAIKEKNEEREEK